MKACAIICLAFMLSAGSCGKRSVQIDHATRSAIDSLAAKEINVLRPQLDSLCGVQFDSLVAYAVDSIMEVRQIEQQILISK